MTRNTMPADEGSTRVVYAALAGNVAVAIAKFGAYAFSGSSAMMHAAAVAKRRLRRRKRLLIRISWITVNMIVPPGTQV